MSYEQSKAPGSKIERASKWLRNINLLGAAALTGAALVVPELSVPLMTFAAVDIAQAGFFHVAGTMAKKRKTAGLAPAPSG